MNDKKNQNWINKTQDEEYKLDIKGHDRLDLAYISFITLLLLIGTPFVVLIAVKSCSKATQETECKEVRSENVLLLFTEKDTCVDAHVKIGRYITFISYTDNRVWLDTSDISMIYDDFKNDTCVTTKKFLKSLSKKIYVGRDEKNYIKDDDFIIGWFLGSSMESRPVGLRQ